MNPEEHDRLRWMVFHDTVKHLSFAGGLTVPQIEWVRRMLVPGAAFAADRLPPDCREAQAKLLDVICLGLVIFTSGPVPDYAPEDDK